MSDKPSECQFCGYETDDLIESTSNRKTQEPEWLCSLCYGNGAVYNSRLGNRLDEWNLLMAILQSAHWIVDQLKEESDG